jgi:hypothetical protein
MFLLVGEREFEPGPGAAPGCQKRELPLYLSAPPRHIKKAGVAILWDVKGASFLVLLRDHPVAHIK